MAVLAADFRTSFRLAVNGSNATVLPNATVDEYLLRGLRRSNSDLLWNIEDDTVALSANTPAVALASDAVEVLWVLHGAREPLNRTDFSRLRQRGLDWENCDPDFPREYVHQGRNLILFPRPSAGAITFAANLTVRTVDSPADISDATLARLADQDTDLPLYWAIAEFCAATWRRSLGPEASVRYLELYKLGIEAARYSYGRRFLERRA